VSIPAILLAAAVALFLAYRRAHAIVWMSALALGLALLTAYSGWPAPLIGALWAILAAAAVALHPGPVRRALVSRPLLAFFRGALPAVSRTEQEAIEAGTVWWEGELFGGDPDWERLLALPKPELSAEERAFLEGPVEELCAMLDEWRITHELRDLPAPVWRFLKERGFFGMIIPKEYGGLGFSALAHSEVVTKITTRSSTAAITVMVPNSLGPGELLLHYGTPEQKAYYLPRLAKGLEIPCFALTSPEAGSDAGAIPDFGVVCRGEWRGSRDVLGIRLTWEKRYITLAPVATLLGLAFRLYDPDRLLGGEEDLGITLALIPADTPGVHIGRRHLPLDAAFMNGPTWGRDVFVPMECVIGGRAQLGEGWKMLMNSLAAGRGISLPSNSCGVAKLCALATGAYGRVRQQFRLPIGRFEGVEEALARIGGNTYLMDAARVMTAGAVDLGERPAVVSAIAKYHLTERARQVVNDAMDVHGGKAICKGPSNYLALAYEQMPIAITVEGANILTRSMIIFGQGAIRAHPYLLEEIAATREGDARRAVRAFDAALFGHAAFFARNLVRTLWLGLTRALFVRAPDAGRVRGYFRQLTRLASAFALCADVALLVLGGALKRRERISARLGDVLSQLYLASAVLKRHRDEGSPQEDLPLVDWAVQDALHRIEEAFYGLFDNLPGRVLAGALKRVVFPYGREFRPPSDEIGRRVAGILLEPSAARERLTRGVYVPRDENEPIGALEAALRAVVAAEPIGARIRAARDAGRLAGRFAEEIVEEAFARGLIGAEEKAAMERARALRRKVVMVDDFPRDFGPSEIHQSTRPVTFEALRRGGAARR
jgi:acyl-CoA dehydrogenase